jgi:hypothetical protein
LRLEAENTPEVHVLKDVGQRRREATLHREVAAVKQGHFYSSENGTDESRNTNTSSCMKRAESRACGLMQRTRQRAEGLTPAAA